MGGGGEEEGAFPVSFRSSSSFFLPHRAAISGWGLGLPQSPSEDWFTLAKN